MPLQRVALSKLSGTELACLCQQPSPIPSFNLGPRVSVREYDFAILQLGSKVLGPALRAEVNRGAVAVDSREYFPLGRRFVVTPHDCEYVAAHRNVAVALRMVRVGITTIPLRELGPVVAVREDDHACLQLGRKVLGPSLGGEVDVGSGSESDSLQRPLEPVGLVAADDGQGGSIQRDLAIAARVVRVKVTTVPDGRFGRARSRHDFGPHEAHELEEGIGHLLQLALDHAAHVRLRGALGHVFVKVARRERLLQLQDVALQKLRLRLCRLALTSAQHLALQRLKRHLQPPDDRAGRARAFRAGGIAQDDGLLAEDTDLAQLLRRRRARRRGRGEREQRDARECDQRLAYPTSGHRRRREWPCLGHEPEHERDEYN
mmetsp:Transcript_15917/g.40648  ORF Transcript_15917/g.40648 Transcript_15917/m.40648 type:complete len:375 (-) Transcript_15917:12-1136(-)